MLNSFFKITFRNLVREWRFTLINLSGLVLGLTVSILIILYIINEFSYDRYHEKADQIYRIALTGQISGQPFETVATPVPLAPTMGMEFPEVINATRIFSSSHNTFFSYGDKKFYEKGILFTDSSFFNIFSKSVILL